MADNRDIMNRFFVGVFNKILACEERALGTDEVTVNEIHIIETVSQLSERGENTMKNIAAEQSLSAGAASIAVNNLVKKGYLIRESGKDDRRKVFIFLTEKAERVEARHRGFHYRMIASIEKDLSEDELNVLSKSLLALEKFFAGAF